MNRYDVLAEHKLGFGKYWDRPLREVPLDYLLWLLDQPPRRDEQGTIWIVKNYLAMVSKLKKRAARKRRRHLRRKPGHVMSVR